MILLTAQISKSQLNYEKTNTQRYLIKKYHQDLVSKYSEYPTKDHWKFEFKNDEYKSYFGIGFPKNQDKKIFLCSYSLY